MANVLDRINKIDKIGDDENPDNPVNPIKKDYQQKAICGNECGFVDCKSGDNNFPWPDIGERGIGNDKHQKAGQTYFLMFHKSLKPLKLFSTRALYPDSSLADLYDPLSMPIELRKAQRGKEIAADWDWLVK